MVQAADSSNQPIFPQWKSPTEWPWTINLMVAEARRILSYLTNVLPKAQPPKAIWHSPDKCKDFIEANSGFSDDATGGNLLEFDEPELQ